MTATTLMLASATAVGGMVGDVADVQSTSQVSAEKDFTGLIGVGALLRPEYIGSNDDETKAVPLINISYKDTVYFAYNRLGVWFWKSADASLRFGAVAKPRRGYEDHYDKRLRGMGDRDDSIEAGLNVAWRYDRANIEIGYLTDVSDESDGNSAYVNLGYAFLRSPEWSLSGHLNFEYLDDDVTRYYWGVPKSRATANRSAYKPDEAWNTSVGLIGSYAFADSWQLLGGAFYTMTGDEIADSPIVKEEDYMTAFVGVGWKF
jgi:outer membrane protein